MDSNCRAFGLRETTVLRILTAFERPAAGTILWNGTPLENVPGPVLKSSVIHVAQTPAMVAATVHTNLHLSFGFRNHRGRPRPSAEQLRHLLGQMGMEMGYVLTMIFRVRHPAPRSGLLLRHDLFGCLDRSRPHLQ
ncbi:MAG: hypothetical protein ACUVSA_13165 [Desulfosoma sp.]|uniref:hypothetical protein n=1 Tax=Desulfosoma sp. TaxID=2603217 RepID=UPI00404B1212